MGVSILPVLFDRGVLPWPPRGAMALSLTSLTYVDVTGSCGGHGGGVGGHGDVVDRVATLVNASVKCPKQGGSEARGRLNVLDTTATTTATRTGLSKTCVLL